ncbi:heparitin sulfate lyase [Ornithobacterium rhinotracheale]|uniref:heparin lyase I family protein n=1 Tax=Ornithobacterium rhinotracheale TaxID=28251 RepID=UPI00129C6A54|nr:heparin lyase I family protein [Ornithobacterium rhinotracheale]MRJ07936.1 heparitin sulfate lyase [Ornithobacterium rhinotracheale]UOH78553.1 polysaccharide lyase [Ornithobacterium rhinotracheale]
MAKFLASLLITFSLVFGLKAQSLKPFTERVNIQTECASPHQILNKEWVAIGINHPYNLMIDSTLLWQGKPSFRFELGAEDNTLSGYQAGTTKGRIELSHCFAQKSDFKRFSDSVSESKSVYFYGQTIYPQGSSGKFEFSIFLPSDFPNDASCIFAQWHGMPFSRLVKFPNGEVQQLSAQEFSALLSQMIFKKEQGFTKIPIVDKNGNPKLDAQGNPRFKAGTPNGYKVEQGGFPPLAFGFSNGYFYIKANSDAAWFSDKTDRTNANVAKLNVLESVKSRYKVSTLAYKMPIAEFPKNQWVTFKVDLAWSTYSPSQEKMLKNGFLDVEMQSFNQRKYIVKRLSLPMGRNDEQGYYFKFGIYRVGNSTTPVYYNLAGYSEKIN